MTDTPTPKRRTLNDAEQFNAYRLISDHLQGPVEGRYVYTGGYSDERVAAEVGCTLANIVGLRERAFGKIAKTADIVMDPRVDELIAAHNELVRDLRTRFGSTFDADPYIVTGGK